jgi:hypothetical protein
MTIVFDFIFQIIGKKYFQFYTNLYLKKIKLTLMNK